MVDVRKELALREMEEKAQDRALIWFEKNYDKVYGDPLLNPEQIPRNAAELHKELVETRKRLMQLQKEEDEEARLRRRPPKKAREIKFSEELLKRGPMYPVPEHQRKLIYDGVSHNNEGRWAYLHERLTLRPEMKYYDPLTYQMEYGWKVEERAWRPMKEFVRRQVIFQSFYRRAGALEPDDLRRRQPFSVAHKCVEILA